MAQGWRLLNQSRPVEAAHAFEAVLQSAPPAGIGRTPLMAARWRCWRRATAPAPAAPPPTPSSTPSSAATSACNCSSAAPGTPTTPDRYTEALTWLDRRAAYAAETRDLMQMRVWCLQKLGRTDAAASMQGQLDQQLSR